MSLDVFHLPSPTNCDVQVFLPTASVVAIAAAAGWQVWHKPLGKTMCFIIAVGSGGGGGGGFTRAVNVNGGGGGGGGGSGLSQVIIPMHLLPDRLYIEVCLGGVGGAAGASGLGGLQSTVSLYNEGVAPTAKNTLLISGTSSGQGGGPGASGSGGAGGSAGVVGSEGANEWCIAGHFSSIAGITGAVGGAPNVAGLSAPLTLASNAGIACTGGAGGAGVSTADLSGGAFLTSSGSNLAFINAPVAGGANAAGCGGVTLWKPFFSYGGGGGGSSNTSVGSTGGSGGIGAGGGGAGAGTTGGKGGDGGPGMVIIISW